MANIKRIINFNEILELIKISDISNIWIEHERRGDDTIYYLKYILSGNSNKSCETTARFHNDSYKVQKVLLKIIKLIQSSPKQFETEYLVIFPDNIYLSSEIDFGNIDL